MRNPTRAKGFDESGTGTRKIAIAFDDDTFETIRLLAVENNCSFAQIVRAYVNEGLTNRIPLDADTQSPTK